MGISEKSVWYKDYIRTTDDDKFILKHFIKDFLFQHRLRYMVYFRKAQTTSVPVQAMAGTKKDTLEALSEIAEALK